MKSEPHRCCECPEQRIRELGLVIRLMNMMITESANAKQILAAVEDRWHALRKDAGYEYR